MYKMEMWCETFEGLSIHVLCEHVSRVLLSVNFSKLNISCFEPLLHPQISNMKVSNFAEPTAPADPYGRRRVSEDIESERQAKVCT